MKKMFALMACLAMLAGCAGGGLNIGGDTNTQVAAYAAGKGVGAAVNKYVQKADPELSAAWSDMMKANAGADPVPAERIMQFYTDSIMNLSKFSKDPYGLVSDLTFILGLYGGQISPDGQLTLAKPIPLATMRAFELGYNSGRSAVREFKLPQN